MVGNPLALVMACEEERARRMEACKVCERYVERSGRCAVCGCFVRLASAVLRADCPIGKWGWERRAISIDGAEGE